jgi:hypothetical protein
MVVRLSMSDPILSLPVALRLIDLQGALNELKRLVDSRAAPDAVKSAIAYSTTVAEELDQLVPGAHILAGDRGLPRHLGFASRYRCVGTDYPDQDAFELVTYDYPRVVARIGSTSPDPERATELRTALLGLEDATTEFKEALPKQLRELAHEFAALAPAGGSVYIGIDDDGRVAGLWIRSSSDADEFDRRVRGVASTVEPPVKISTWWLAIGDLVVVEAQIHPSGEPIHYVDHVPYIRDGSASRPARPAEVVRAVREHDTQTPRLRIDPGPSTFFGTQDDGITVAFAHVRVTNVGPFVRRVRGFARFLAGDGTTIHQEPMSLRWSSAPEPLTVVWTPDGPQPVSDMSKVPLSLYVDIPTGEAEDTAVAVKFSDVSGAWGWTGESYLNGWRHPKWRLPDSDVVVEVSIRAEGRVETRCFRLKADAPLEEFSASPDDDAGPSAYG